MLRSVGSKGARIGKIASNVFGTRLRFRAAFLAVVAVAVSYATALLAVVYAYRKAYGLLGKPKLALPRSTTQQRYWTISFLELLRGG